MFSALFSTAKTLKVNEPATVTIKLDVPVLPIYDLYVKNKVKNALEEVLGSTAEFLDMKRAIGSGRYTVTFRPKYSMTEEQWKSAFQTVIKNAGYDASIFEVVGGWESTQPGGVIQAVTSTVERVGETPVISQTLSTTKWVALAVLAVMVLPYLPKPRWGRK